MGCWNKTCGLSSLHIFCGTPVYVFVLEKNDTHDQCYTTSLYHPLLLPFESAYNDYGGGEGSSGVAFPLIMDGLKTRLVEMPVGENKYHDIEVTRAKFNEELFFEAVHEDRLRLTNPFDPAKPTGVYFTMMRKDVVDKVLSGWYIESYVGEGKGNMSKYGSDNNYLCYNYTDAVAGIRPLLDEARAKLSELRAVDPAIARYKILSGLDLVAGHDSVHPAARLLRSCDSYRYSRIVDIRHLVIDTFTADTDESFEQLANILSVYLKGVFIEVFMESCRKTWLPGGHEGSQNTSGDGLRTLAEATLSVLDSEDEEYL